MEFLMLWKIPGRQIFSAVYRHCQACRNTFGRISNTLCSKTFKQIVFRHNNVLLFLCFWLLLFSLLLLTITRKKLFLRLQSYVIQSRLCTINIAWKYVGLVVKHPKEMLLKYLSSVGSALYQKMIAPNLHVILKKIFMMRMTYMQPQQNRLVCSTLMSV